MRSWEIKLDLLRTSLPNVRVAVGLDPGRHMTGCVVITLSPLIAVFFATRLPNEKMFDLLWDLEPDFIFIEGFRLYPWIALDKRWDYFPEVRTIGAVEEIARVCQIKLVEVSPSESKKLIPNSLLHLIGTWAVCNHTTDAFRVFWAVVLRSLELEEDDGTTVDKRVSMGTRM